MCDDCGPGLFYVLFCSDYFKSLKNPKPFASISKAGVFCSARFTDDDEWYRAKIIDVGQPSEFCKY